MESAIPAKSMVVRNIANSSKRVGFRGKSASVTSRRVLMHEYEYTRMWGSVYIKVLTRPHLAIPL